MSYTGIASSERAKTTFYPTPEALADKLLAGIDWMRIQSILEPSAGKGDLAMAVVKAKTWRDRFRSAQERVKSCDIDCIEIDPVMENTLSGSGFRVVHDDFLTFETQKRYDLIVMNPPFDQGDRHLLKALELMKRGGSIRCILNAETIRNQYSLTRQRLVKLLDGYGAKISYEVGAFAAAERKTNVEAALVYVDIPKEKVDSTIMEEMRRAPTYKAQKVPEKYAELVRHNAIDAWVNRYNFEVGCGVRLLEEHQAMTRCLRDGEGMDEDPVLSIIYTGTRDGRTATINGYIRSVRNRYWNAIFKQPAFKDKLTSNLTAELYDMINELQDYDFSAYNILTLLGKMNTRICRGIEDTIISLFDDWTRNSWSEESPNRHYYDGWATNDCFSVRKKVIIPLYAYGRWSGNFEAYNVAQKFRDIEKVFDFLDSGRTEWEGSVEQAFKRAEETGNAKNIDTKYFTVTFYKKGTAHLVFKDDDLLEKFNIFAGQRKGWLPPSYGKKRYRDMSQIEKHVVDSFQGKERYEQVMAQPAYYLGAGETEGLKLIG